MEKSKLIFGNFLITDSELNKIKKESYNKGYIKGMNKILDILLDKNLMLKIMNGENK